MRGGTETRSIVERVEQRNENIGVTTVSLFELLTPIYHKRFDTEERVIRTFLRQCAVLGLDFPSAEEAAKIMGRLRRLGKPVNALDALIAGIASSNRLDNIVTRDRDFQEIAKISDLKVQLI